MAGFWSGGRTRYLAALRRRYEARLLVLTRRYRRAETIEGREETRLRILELKAEFREQKRSGQYSLF